jgi:hypothetical protein
MRIDIKTTDNITPALVQMNTKDIQKAMKNGVRKAGQMGLKEIKQSYKKTGIKYHPDRKKKKDYGDPVKGIKAIQSRKNVLDLKFSIMGDFRLKWFEKGTAKRKTERAYTYKNRKGTEVAVRVRSNRGSIKPVPFFAPATKRIMNEVKQIYEKSFDDAINKIVNKKRHG